MKSLKKSICAGMFLSSILLMILSGRAQAWKKQWVIFRDNIPRETERFSITLEFTNSNSSFYEVSDRELKSEQIQEDKQSDGYTDLLDMGTAVDGNQYSIMFKEPGGMNFIGRDSERICMGRIVRTGGKKTETIREGFIIPGREMEIPLVIPSEQIGIPSKRTAKGSLKIYIHNDNSSAYRGQVRTTINGVLSGSTAIPQAFLNASIRCGNTLELKDRNLSLSLKPFDNQMVLADFNGKISDAIKLGAGDLVVEKIASDGSELVLAHLSGELVQEVKKEQILVIGQPFPAFTRVELVKRQLLTLEDLTKQAGDAGYIVLIFGNLKAPFNMPPGYPRPQMSSLDLDEKIICDILRKNCNKPIIVGFVCQQLSLSNLYENWLGRDPDFLVFSDFSNPLNVQFTSGGMERYMHGPMPNPNEKGETLRGQLRFDVSKTAAVLIDASGKLVYLNTDAGGELAACLEKINSLIAEGKKAEKQE